MKQFYISSKEYDFLKTPHLIKSYNSIKFNYKVCLRCKMEDKITIWHNNKLHIFDDVLLVNRLWLKCGLRKLKKLPIEVHIIDYNSIKNNSLKGAFNIAWGYLSER